MKNKAHSSLDRISSVLLAVAFILLPIFILPYLDLTFVYAKVTLLTVCAFVAAILAIVHVINKKSLTQPSWQYVGLLALVPVVYALSAFFSSHVSMGLIGQGADLDTFFAVALGMLITGLVAVFSRDRKQSVFMLGLGFSGVALLITLYHLLRFMFGPQFLSFGLFVAATSNTVGSLGDLGIYAGLAVIVSLISLEFLSFGMWIRAGFYALLVTSLSVAVIANFNLLTNLWGTGLPISLAFLLCLAALVIFIHKKVTEPKGMFPYLSCVVFFVALICTIQANTVARFILPHTGITQVEVLDIRAAPADAGQIAMMTMKSGTRPALLGVGPNRFFAAWGAFKPMYAADATTPPLFRQSDFSLSFSYIATALVSEGLLGFLSWLFFFGVILYYIYLLFKKIIREKIEPLSAYSSAVVSVATIYLWIAASLYTPGPVVFFLAFFFTGLLFGRVMAEGLIPVKVITWEEAGYWKSFAIVFVLVIFMAAIVSSSYIWATKTLAATYAQGALNTFQSVRASDTDDAKGKAIASIQNDMAKAINLSPSSDYLRFYTEVSLIRPTQFINTQTGTILPSDITGDVATDINRAIAGATEAALQYDQTDYRNWIELGKVYETTTFLGATTTATLSLQSYAQAAKLNPTSPYPPFYLGRVFIYAKKPDLAKQQLELALKIEPTYSDAATLLKLVDSSPSAAAAAVTSVPVQETGVATSTATTTKSSVKSNATSTSATKK